MNHLKKFFIILPFLLACVSVISLSSCHKSDLTTDYTDLPGNGWAYGDSISFFMHRDSVSKSKAGNLSLGIRHTGDYPYCNLWLEVTTSDAKGVSRVDTVNVDLCDSFGRWYGHGFGNSFQITVPVASDIRLDTLTKVNITHIMRVDTLVGLTQLGVFYEQAP